MFQGLIYLLTLPAAPAGSQPLEESHEVVEPARIVRLHLQSRIQPRDPQTHLYGPHSAIWAALHPREAQASLRSPDACSIHDSNAHAATAPRASRFRVSPGIRLCRLPGNISAKAVIAEPGLS